MFTDNPNFWALEQAVIQLWQPRLNTPFIYQFFNCRKGLIVQRPFSSTRQFGTFSLWRKLRWASTPQRIRATFYSKRFHDRTVLWEVIQHLGSNSLKRFQMEKPHQVPRVWPPRMLLYPQARIQHERTSEILCFSCHRQGHPILERQTSSSLLTSTSPMDIVTYMVLRPSQIAPSTYCPDETSFSDFSDPIFRSGLHQESISQRQPLQSQALRHPMG